MSTLKTDSSEKEIILTYDDIIQLIPHRYPFLMVDRVEKVIVGEEAVGLKNVTINEPFFQGHFPNYPIMPGVLIIEALAQTAGILVSYSMSLKTQTHVYFMSVEEAKFRRPVVPGDALELKVRKIHNRKTIWKFKGEAYVKGVLHAETICTAMVGGQA